ncbi:MAG TPA: FtsX-like permease family protein, partial [Gammaproteobacteria bacterium]|nr:FtsX-like permease family protein [Gammaproteobacteria bacterium]
DPTLPFEVTTLREHLGLAVLPQRAGAIVIGALGGIGMLLAALGLYGVLSYLVARRTREIGIRLALGSRPRAVMRMVLGTAASLTLVGLALGLGTALVAARLAAGFLFGVGAQDPVTFAAAGLLFAGVAFVAAYGPARRATRVDPSEALRSE